MDGCNVLPETLFAGTRLRVDTTRVVSVGGSPPLWSCWREVRVLHQTAFRGSTPDFSSRLSPEVFSTSGYFRKTVAFEIRVFPLLGELPKAIEPHLPVCSYPAGNSVPTCGLRLRPSRLTPSWLQMYVFNVLCRILKTCFIIIKYLSVNMEHLTLHLTMC